jgi:hypothetical protein
MLTEDKVHNVLKNEMRHDLSLAILYLIRNGEDEGRAHKFLNSLIELDTENVELYVIIKSLGDEVFNRSIKDIFSSSFLRVQFIELDDIGFDIGAYFMVSQLIKEDLILPMSSSSVFSQTINFTRIKELFEDSKLGLVGTTASQESLNPLKMTRIQNRIEEELSLSVFMTRMLKTMMSILHATYYSKLKYLIFFSKFPNTHIRTTGFIIRRDLFLNILNKMPRTRFQSLLLESGRNNLVKRVQKAGLNVFVYYEDQLISLKNPLISKSFRNTNCASPYVVDHWWIHFHDANEDEKIKLKKQTWSPDFTL